MTLTLQDPQTGTRVFLAMAQLPQHCLCCGLQLEGTWCVAVEGGNWICLEHLERTLLTQGLSAEFTARFNARAQLHDAQPGDTITVTRQLLAALRIEE